MSSSSPTLSGDIIIFTIEASGMLTQRWRTYVPGAAGFYNSILAEDILNNDGRKELYVAGSLGLWRFVRPEEGQP